MKRFKLKELCRAVGAALDRAAFNYLDRLGLVFQVARTVVDGITGATLSISATIPESYDQAGYESTDVVFTAIGEVEDHGNHGMNATVSTFIPVDTGVVAKIKGSKDYGTKSLMVGYLPGNAGQVILKAAADAGNTHYSFRISYADGEKHYLDALVVKHETQDGAANNVRKAAVDLAVTRAPVVVLP